MGRVSAADRSQQFVEAAARVIAQEGVAAATTRRIAREADAPLAALHYCFRNKEDLLLEVYHHLSRDYARQLDPLPEHAGLAEVVDLHMRRIWRRMAAHPHEQITTFELLLRGQRLTNPREREQAQQVNRQMYDAWISSTAAIFDAGAAVSGVTPATDTTVAARFTVAGIDGISIQHFSDPDEERSWRMIDELVRALQSMLLPR